MSDTGDLITLLLKLFIRVQLHRPAAGNIKEDRIYDPIPNVLLPSELALKSSLGFRNLFQRVSRCGIEHQMQNLGFPIHRFGRIPVAEVPG